MATTDPHDSPAPKLYHELAAWWPLMSAPADYAEEARIFKELLLEDPKGSVSSLLELGSGGGNNASHMKADFQEVVLVDLSQGMLTVSEALNPECQHVRGDMREVRLDRQFDRVFVHDAVDYMTTLADLRSAMETALVHCRPGGMVLFAPDHLRENFAPSTDCGGHDGERRAMRYLEWCWDPNPSDSEITTDYVYVMREGDAAPRLEWDRHVTGLFSRSDWMGLLSDVGFVDARTVPFEHSEVEPGQIELFLARRP